MKFISFFLGTLLICLTTNLSATIWRVNNTGADADFTTIQAAHDGASAGDTLHIEPSGTSYGNLSISKQLVVIGNGFFLSDNPDLQANQIASTIGAVIFSATSDGSIFKGISSAVTWSINAGADNLQIIRCSLVQPQIRVVANLYMNGCYLRNNNVAAVYFLDAATGFIITNCIMVSNSTSRSAVSGTTNMNGTFRNCVFAGRLSNVQGSTIENCIHSTGTFTSLSNNSYRNNISHTTTFGTNNNNQANVAMSTVFGSSTSTDGQYQIDPTGPAAGTGVANEDIGAFGGATAYKLSGIPDIPSIYKLEAPSGGTGNVTITISTRANN